jgi:5,10-methylenetetrahydrofolate reductase
MQIAEIVRQKGFVITCEVDSPKGIGIEEFLDKVDYVKSYVDAIVAGDNQRAVMRAAPLAVCHLLKQKGLEPVMELSARYRNRLALQSDLLGAGILGIENILLLDGYDPSFGDHAEAKSVLDLTCCDLVKAASALTKGADLTGHTLNEAPRFCLGVFASIAPGVDEKQVSDLKEKIAAGASFVQTQPIYDADALARFLQATGKLNVPVIVGHMMLKSASMARFMNSNLPGVKVPEPLIHELEGVTREHIVEKSIQLSVDLLKQLKPMCQGFHFIPAGWERYVGNVVSEVMGKGTSKR